MSVTKVPDVEAPIRELCWAQCVPTINRPSPLRPMTRCDRAKDHGGKHTWEVAEDLEAAKAAWRIVVDRNIELERLLDERGR